MPVALLETPTLERRRYCECCGFPSLIVPDISEDYDNPNWVSAGSPWWAGSVCACDLCEWESRPLDEQGDPLSTSEDERNDGVTLEQARANVARFGDTLMAAKPGEQWEQWNAVTEAERNVRGALIAQQAADEEQIAEQWDESEEPES